MRKVKVDVGFKPVYIGGFNQRLHLELHFVFRKTSFIGAVAAYAGTAQKQSRAKKIVPAPLKIRFLRGG